MNGTEYQKMLNIKGPNVRMELKIESKPSLRFKPQRTIPKRVATKTTFTFSNTKTVFTLESNLANIQTTTFINKRHTLGLI